MTTKLNTVFRTLAALPADRQDEVAEMIGSMAIDPYDLLSPEDRAEIAHAFAKQFRPTDEERVIQFFARHGCYWFTA